MRSLTQHQIYFITSALLAGIITFLLYPGWLYYDSVHQWRGAELIIDRGWPEKLSSLGISTHWPIFNTVLRIPFYALTQGAGLYIWCQALAVFFSIYLLTSCFFPEGGKKLAIAYGVICMMPTVLNLSVLHASDVAVTILYIVLIVLFWQYSSGQQKASTYKPLIIACCAMIFVQLLRNNVTVSLFLAAPLILWHLLPKNKHRKTATCVLLAITIATPASINNYLNSTARYSTSSTQGISLHLILQDHTYYSEAAQPILSRIRKLKTDTIDTSCYSRGIWCTEYYSTADGRTITLDSTVQSPMRIAYIMSLLESPFEWFNANLPIMAGFTGVTTPIKDECVGRYDSIKNFNKDIGITMERNAVRDFFQNAAKATAWIGFGRPVYLLLLNLILAIWLWARSPVFASQSQQILALLYITLLYMAPLILAAPDPQQRYYYPFVLPNMVLCVAMLLRLPETFRKQVN